MGTKLSLCCRWPVAEWNYGVVRRTARMHCNSVSWEYLCLTGSLSRFATVLWKWVLIHFTSKFWEYLFSHPLTHLTCSAANNLGVDAIFVYTKHGQMASLLSRIRPNSPIFAFTDNSSTRMRMNLQWGVTPILAELSEDMEANITKTIDLIKMKGILEEGDEVLVVSDISPSCATPKAFQSIQVKTIV